MARLLLAPEYGADADRADNNGRTPLHPASGNGKLEVVRALVEDFGADVHAKDNDGDTPLGLAELRNRTEVEIEDARAVASSLTRTLGCGRDTAMAWPLQQGHGTAMTWP